MAGKLIRAEDLITKLNGIEESFIDLADAIEMVDACPAFEINGSTSDGYHTFDELYHHRAVLFSVIVAMFNDRAWKSRQHHDGTMYDGMFIVGIDTPDGQATYHYDINPYWPMFDCQEIDRAPEWDGHTPEQAIERIGKLRPPEGEWMRKITGDFWCSHCGALYEDDPHADKYRYCNACGARMRIPRKR